MFSFSVSLKYSSPFILCKILYSPYSSYLSFNLKNVFLLLLLNQHRESAWTKCVDLDLSQSKYLCHHQPGKINSITRTPELLLQAFPVTIRSQNNPWIFIKSTLLLFFKVFLPKFASLNTVVYICLFLSFLKMYLIKYILFVSGFPHSFYICWICTFVAGDCSLLIFIAV